MHSLFWSKIFHYCGCEYKQVKRYLLLIKHEILWSGSTVHLYKSWSYPIIHCHSHWMTRAAGLHNFMFVTNMHSFIVWLNLNVRCRRESQMTYTIKFEGPKFCIRSSILKKSRPLMGVCMLPTLYSSYTHASSTLEFETYAFNAYSPLKHWVK